MRRPFLVELAEPRTLLSERIEAGTAVPAFTADLLHRMSGQQDRPVPRAALTRIREQVVRGGA
jgi:hypothetical protein